MKLAVFNISEGTLREHRQWKLLTVRVSGYYSEYYVFACLGIIIRLYLNTFLLHTIK